MYIKTRGLVLRVTDYNEYDALLTILTQDYGRMTVKARGLRRKNSPLIAPCQLLALGEYTLFEYKGIYTVNEAHSVELFQGLRRDLLKLSLGTYFAQVAEVISQADMPTPELLSLVCNCLYALSKLEVSDEQIKAAFELRCACLAGYTPDLSACHICGNIMPDRFDVSSGVLVCSSCRKLESSGLRLPLSPGMLEAMRYILTCEPKRLLGFLTTKENLEALSQLTQTYLSTQLERGFSTLDFYKSLLIQG